MPGLAGDGGGDQVPEAVGSENVVGVAVDVVSGSVVAQGGAGVGVAAGDLDVAEVRRVGSTTTTGGSASYFQPPAAIRGP
jgi:hypothetical protein